MHNVEIKVFLIAKTTVEHTQTRAWLDHVGAKNYQVPSSLEASEAAKLISMAGRRCYMAFEPKLNPNVTKIRESLVDYFDNILASGHGSILEHATYSFAIEGVSRVFTAEMNRHRAGWAISEGSLRYVRFSDIPWWLPPSIRESPADDPELAEKKHQTREIFNLAFEQDQANYRTLLKIWDLDDKDKNFHYKKVVTSCLRRIIGMGVATGGIWTGNIRAIRHVLAMRAAPAAEEEIAFVFGMIGKLIRDEEPLLFGDFTQTPEGYWVPKWAKV